MQIKNLLFVFFATWLFAVGRALPQPTQGWVSSFNGSGNGGDYLMSMALDNSGNVYVTGASWGGTSKYDIVTIKYNSSGVQLWVRSYNGPADSVDRPAAIAVDALGNVYVTGYTTVYFAGTTGTSGMRTDYVTIKYSSDGTQLWTALYDGPVHYFDYGKALAVDNIGNVYVTGQSWQGGTGYDYVTIKYDESGSVAWLRGYNYNGNYDYGTNVLVDNSGNVYVTGNSMKQNNNVSQDYATLKYNSAGVQQWVQRYDGSGSGLDHAAAMTLDRWGNVIVTGDSWGGSVYDIATVKYSPSGSVLWIQRYAGSANASGIAADQLGNIYVAGRRTIAGNDDYLTLQYNSAGIQQWVRTYNGPANSTDIARSIALDGSASVYVTGESSGGVAPGTGYDFATVKYSSSGIQQWVQRYNSSGGNYDYAVGVKVNECGTRIYTSGYSYTPGQNYNYAVVQYVQCAAKVNAGNDVTIYLGYGNQSATLTANAACGTEPYLYLWSTSETTQSITVSPLETTSYYVTVTDAEGCIGSDTVVVNVIDVRCNEPMDHKVLVCHKDRNTICVDSHAVSAHLAHGDYLGSCSGNRIFIPEDVPGWFKLEVNYPNPFNPLTSIGFELPEDSRIKLTIYDVTGRQVEVIAESYYPAGRYKVIWNAGGYPSGVYFYCLEANGNVIDTKRMILLK